MTATALVMAHSSPCEPIAQTSATARWSLTICQAIDVRETLGRSMPKGGWTACPRPQATAAFRDRRHLHAEAAQGKPLFKRQVVHAMQSRAKAGNSALPAPWMARSRHGITANQASRRGGSGLAAGARDLVQAGDVAASLVLGHLDQRDLARRYDAHLRFGGEIGGGAA